MLRPASLQWATESLGSIIFGKSVTLSKDYADAVKEITRMTTSSKPNIAGNLVVPTSISSVLVDSDKNQLTASEFARALDNLIDVLHYYFRQEKDLISMYKTMYGQDHGKALATLTKTFGSLGYPRSFFSAALPAGFKAIERKEGNISFKTVVFHKPHLKEQALTFKRFSVSEIKQILSSVGKLLAVVPSDEDDTLYLAMSKLGEKYSRAFSDAEESGDKAELAEVTVLFNLMETIGYQGNSELLDVSAINKAIENILALCAKSLCPENDNVTVKFK